ncbi:hypothetical protein SDC9_119958 [bioreactor metagenome]|uniref:Uncharacterized protein n=1 Tax=bioreactor metagenome TaxID=1076179 RepID=A0A645C5Q1_9ZZZZ
MVAVPASVLPLYPTVYSPESIVVLPSLTVTVGSLAVPSYVKLLAESSMTGLLTIFTEIVMASLVTLAAVLVAVAATEATT